MNKIYFSNLNGLRFIAALLVIVHHVEQFKSLLGIDNFWASSLILNLGKLGVILFFVLSGFLITYLLLAEEKHSASISIKNFYIRRILRIWPLYYLIFILGFFLLPNIPFFKLGWTSSLYDQFYSKAALFLFFLPNLALTIYMPVAYAAQCWSVGVEEQFYLIWPVLMKKFKKKERLLYIVIWGYLFVQWGVLLLKKFGIENAFINIFQNFWSSFSIDCMAIGGLLAILLFKKDPKLKFLFNKYLQAVTLIILSTFLYLGLYIPYVNIQVYAILFGILILNLAANPKPLFSLENSLFNYLGKISFGLYMFHPIAIVIVLKILLLLNISSLFMQYFVSLIITIIIASCSYSVFESKLIKFKTRFSIIISGDNAR